MTQPEAQMMLNLHHFVKAGYMEVNTGTYPFRQGLQPELDDVTWTQNT